MEPFDSFHRYFTRKSFEREYTKSHKRLIEAGVNLQQINFLANDEKFMSEVVDIAKQIATGNASSVEDAIKRVSQMGETKSIVALAIIKEAMMQNLKK